MQRFLIFLKPDYTGIYHYVGYSICSTLFKGQKSTKYQKNLLSKKIHT